MVSGPCSRQMAPSIPLGVTHVMQVRAAQVLCSSLSRHFPVLLSLKTWLLLSFGHSRAAYRPQHGQGL